MRGARQETAEIPGPAGRIEAVVDHPIHETTAAVAVLCHPHPLYHGTMTNKVVHTLARTTVQLGHPAVRFNFRGVGRSEGGYGEGAGEAMDARAVVDWSRARWPGAALWLGGFSFGAFVALSIAADVSPARLLTVAPPLHRFDMGALPLPRCPWLIIQGVDDELVDAAAVEAWAATLDPSPGLCLLADTDHFFHGRLTLLREVATEFLEPRAPEEENRC